jgi:signal transduction histidine kinase
MKRSRVIGVGLLLVAWLFLAKWQHREYVHQRELTRGALAGQAQSVANAVASGIRSHHWFGPFVQEQLPATLQELAKSDSVLAVAIVSEETRSDETRELAETVSGNADYFFSAGDPTLLDFSLPSGNHWEHQGYVVVLPFEVTNDPPRSRMGTAGGERPYRSGRGVPPSKDVAPVTPFKLVLVLDRSGVDEQIRKEGRNRVLLVVAGGLLLVCIAVAWQATVRLAQAQGRAQVLQTETRHLRELGRAAAGLAHETRNPLGLIRGWTQRLADSELSTSDRKRQSNMVLEECDRVTARINQFLAFARPAEFEPQAVEVRELTEELTVLLEPDIEARHIKLDSEGIVAGTTVRADREQLRQALFNLLQNAIQFASDSGVVTISLKRENDGSFRLAVADDGPGPPPDDVESLFEPYFTSRPGGTGLGLPIVQRIAAAHGWHVGYSPRKGGGSEFWLKGIRS